MHPLQFTPFPSLTTERLILRELSEADIPHQFALLSNAQHRKYIDKPLHQTIQETADFIAFLLEGQRENKWITWAITLKDNPEFIGSICLWNFDLAAEKADVGYELSPPFQGQGIMQEALAAVLDFGLNILKIKQIGAYTNAQNSASRKLLEHKNFELKEIIQELHTVTKTTTNTAIYTLSAPTTSSSKNT